MKLTLVGLVRRELAEAAPYFSDRAIRRALLEAETAHKGPGEGGGQFTSGSGGGGKKDEAGGGKDEAGDDEGEDELDALSGEAHTAAVSDAFGAVDEHSDHESAATAMQGLAAVDDLVKATASVWGPSLDALDKKGADTKAARKVLSALRGKVGEAATAYRGALIDAYRAHGELGDLSLSDPAEAGGPPDEPEAPDGPEDRSDEGSVAEWDDYREQQAAYAKALPAYRAAVAAHRGKEREAKAKVKAAVRGKDRAFSRLSAARDDLEAFGDYELQDAIEPLRRKEGLTEAEQSRGQPENAGQFGPGGGGKKKAEKPARDRGAERRRALVAKAEARMKAEAEARDARDAENRRDVVARMEARMKAEAAADRLRDSARVVGGQRTHGMADTEDMLEGEAHGLRARFPASLAREAQQTLQRVEAAGFPPKLTAATRRVFFTTQGNREDAYWKALYKNFGASTATGGDGDVMVYNGNSASADVMAHEMGHNLATSLWGSTYPPASSEYGQAQRAEKPVTEYGANSPAEDFAEACKMYADRIGGEHDYLKKTFPKKFAALEKLLT